VRPRPQEVDDEIGVELGGVGAVAARDVVAMSVGHDELELVGK
jgi:hypothetical protein